MNKKINNLTKMYLNSVQKMTVCLNYELELLRDWAKRIWAFLELNCGVVMVKRDTVFVQKFLL